jgi:hypothetical protein
MKHLILCLLFLFFYFFILVWQGGAAVGCLTALSKGEIAPFHTMKTYSRRRITVPLILNLSVAHHALASVPPNTKNNPVRTG